MKMRTQFKDALGLFLLHTMWCDLGVVDRKECSGNSKITDIQEQT